MHQYRTHTCGELRLDHAGEPGPISVQIAGSDPAMLADAARRAAPTNEPAERMYRSLLLFIFLCTACAGQVAPSQPFSAEGPARTTRVVSFVATNDLHGHLSSLPSFLKVQPWNHSPLCTIAKSSRKTSGSRTTTSTELEHDYLWRVHARLPRRGHIGVFNRSHYEDVLIVRVHGWASPETIERRYGHINAFERLLHDEVAVPCEIAGQFYPARDLDCYVFQATKGEVFDIEVLSHQLELPTDPIPAASMHM